MAKQTVAVFFGGQSSEHEISCLSAVNVIENINRDKYAMYGEYHYQYTFAVTCYNNWIKKLREDKEEKGEKRERRKKEQRARRTICQPLKRWRACRVFV